MANNTNTGIPPAAASLVTVIALTGCSTIQTHTSGEQALHPYIGTSKAIEKTQRAWHHYDYYGEAAIYSSDILASFIADTLILPYDIYQYLRRPGMPAQNNAE